MFLILLECAKMECLTEKNLYVDTRIYVLDAFYAAVCLKAQHNTSNNV